MKIRIHRNTVRFRLSRTEVGTLEKEGYLEETTDFGAAQFAYAVRICADDELSAGFEHNKVTLNVPASFVTGWAANDKIGLQRDMPLAGGNSLFLLIEKDFKCLDNATEDQSDNYENPNKTC